MTLTVSDILLIREALKIAAARHESQARWVEKKGGVPTSAELDHRTKSERMLDLRLRLGQTKAREIAA